MKKPFRKILPQEDPIEKSRLKPWQLKLHEIIFEADTRAGRLFDIGLLVAILVSIIVVMLESVNFIFDDYGTILVTIEWILTGLFTIEYFLRILSIGKPIYYVFSFYGIVDLLAILPSYLGIWIGGSQTLAVVRALRFLRIFRILKLGQFIDSGNIILTALKNSRHKIIVFMFAVLTIVMIIGSLMFLIEGQQENTGFTSIPRSVYWAIVTLTTVGYGDISPRTALGQTFSSIIMIMVYDIIAVPTGIITSDIISEKKTTSTHLNATCCHNCGLEGQDDDAKFCKRCGTPLDQ
jgi:voltage-gated potassium channel